MTKYLLTLALLFLPSLAFAGSIDREVIAPYVEVRVGNSVGAGTVVKTETGLVILTAAHVVADAHKNKNLEIFASQDDGATITERRCEIVAYSAPEEDGGNDLALLKPKCETGLIPAIFGPTAHLDPGEDAWIIGSPHNLHRCLEKTIINRTDYEHLGHSWTVFNAGWYGDSGGGLYVDQCGHYVLVGVVCRLVETNDPRSPVMAQTAETVNRFLTEYGAKKK
jgi:hypothetical protein